MLSEERPASELICFYCPACRRQYGVERGRLKPGPVLCGRCHIARGVKIQVQRDFTAERASKEERVILANEF